MTPRPSLVHRILPFGLPALLALLLTVWVFQRSENGRGEGDVSSTAGNSPAVKAANGSSYIRETLADSARAARQIQAPAEAPVNPIVADLLDRFQQGDRKMPEQAIRELVSRPLGKNVTLRGAGLEWSGTVDSRLDTGETIHIGVALDDGLGRFQMSLREDDSIQASLLFNGETHALAFRGIPENGNWTMEATSVDRVLCTPAGSIYPIARGQMAMPLAGDPEKSKAPARAPQKAPPILNSNPASPFVIYCDFDGEVVTHPLWNDGNTINAVAHARSDDAVFVTRVWERVSEDYSPFNINVTTDRAVYDTAAESRRVMCVVTSTDLAAPGAGGVAYLGSFGYGIPCWAFNDTEAACADTISHEVGHTVGLLHDGQVNGFAYYGGHGVGPTSWAPLMGAYFADFDPPFVEEEVTQFSKGEYPDADNQEDDLAIITGSNGFTYRNDDKGNDLDDATPLSVSRGKASDSGIIERTTDKDCFSFPTSGGKVSFDVTVTNINSDDDPQRGSNLAVSVELLDSKGKRVTLSNPQDSLDASISVKLKPGNYFLSINGAGRGDLATGFSDYDSLGQYSIKGVVPQDGILTVSPPSLEFPRGGGEGSFAVSAKSKWTWSCEESWVTTTEAVDQSGNQTFDYSISRNTGRDGRTAQIKVTDGAFTAIHSVIQAGSEGDDHGDEIGDATLVEQNSVTDGRLEAEQDLDIFRIDLKGFGDLTVRTTGGTDTYGELLDAYGNRIAGNDNARKPNFSITRSVGTGVYYVAVQHSHEGGVGPYKLVCSFEPSPALIIDPVKRIVGPDGGGYLLRVISNASWTWSSSEPWVTSTSPTSQSNGQVLDYKVLPNNTDGRRTAQITLTSGKLSVVHKIVQNSAKADDHANTTADATPLGANASASGRIEFEGDVDMFRVVLQTSGEISVGTTGSMDSYGQLLNDKGKVIASNDNANGDNFGIVQSVDAGVYYVRVRHFSDNALGAYQLSSKFVPSRLVDVHYAASEGGGIRGPKSQKVPLGGAARTVLAAPQDGFSFFKWSDGLTTASRTDRNLSTHLDVTAHFVRTLSVKAPSGEFVQDNQTPPVDFGVVEAGRSRTKEFTIRNNGSRTLSNITVTKSGPQENAWSNASPSRATLKPGESATLTVTLKSPIGGYKSATYAIAATGTASTFQLRVMGFVGTGIAAAESGAVRSLGAAAESPPIAGASSAPAASPVAGFTPWLAVSPDGFFHYRFHRSSTHKAEPGFWISTNGTAWEEALVLDVWRVARGENSDEFEAIIAPPLLAQPFIIVSETPPAKPKP